jgi:hypothetical protein
VFEYSSSLLDLISSFALVSVNSDVGTVGGSPEIEFLWMGAMIVGLGDFCSTLG